MGCGEKKKKAKEKDKELLREGGGKSLGFLIEESWGICPGTSIDEETVE